MNIDLEEHQGKINILQVKTLKVIEKLFSNYKTENIETQFSSFLGYHGEYTNKEILEIKLKFNVFSYSFEAFLYYNQIEYHIYDKKGETMAKCNIEDFFPHDEMVLKYENYLSADILKLMSS